MLVRPCARFTCCAYTRVPVPLMTCMVAGTALLLLILIRTGCPPDTGLGAMPVFTVMSDWLCAAALVSAVSDIVATRAAEVAAEPAGGNSCDCGMAIFEVEALDHDNTAQASAVFSKYSTT